MAERERFELSRPLRAYGISSAAPSTGLGDRSATHCSNQHRSPRPVEPARDTYLASSMRAFDRATAPLDTLATAVARPSRTVGARRAPSEDWKRAVGT